ncbi:MAG: hypothetical protein AAGA73_20915 [Pseudomonadota bacterium]
MPALERVPDAAAGLALEAGLLSGEEPSVCLWSTATPGLVCPTAYTHHSAFGDATRRSADRGWPVSCRPTGGGAVPQDAGVLNLAMSFTAVEGFTIDDGYRLITQPIRTCLERQGQPITSGATPGSFCDGRWNLSVAGRKIVGTAQRWRPLKDGKSRILAHALILTHGQVAPGAEAVQAFHRDLSLAEDIRPNAHTTLETAFGFKPSALDHLATALNMAAVRELAYIGLSKSGTAAA